MHAMRTDRIAIALTFTFALLALAPLGGAADAPPAVGTWDAVASTPDGDIPVVITVGIVEGQVECQVAIGEVPQKVSEEKLEGDLLSMKVAYEFGLYDVQAKVVGDSMEGTWQGAGYSGPLKATRRPRQQ